MIRKVACALAAAVAVGALRLAFVNASAPAVQVIVNEAPATPSITNGVPGAAPPIPQVGGETGGTLARTSQVHRPGVGEVTPEPDQHPDAPLDEIPDEITTLPEASRTWPLAPAFPAKETWTLRENGKPGGPSMNTVSVK